MFIENKYYHWYTLIVTRARNREVPNVYTEKHHILPKSLGGTDEPKNVVILTGREHFICHLLLIKFTFGKDKHKMIYAAHGMCQIKRDYQSRYNPSSRIYEMIRREFSNTHSKLLTGRKLSAAHKAKISSGNKGRISSPATLEKRVAKTTGQKRTIEQREKMRQAQLARPKKIISEEEHARRSESQKGKHSEKKSEEHKNKISESLTGKYLGVKKSEDTKQRMRKPKTIEHRKAISEARIAKYATMRFNNP
jgi:hypothetical protein